MCLLNPVPDENWIIRVGAYCIRPANAHNHGQMIDPSDTFRGVCNTPLPIPDKYLINMYLLNLIPGKDWIVYIGAYYIRPKNNHVNIQMIDSLDTFRGVCNTPIPVRTKK